MSPPVPDVIDHLAGIAPGSRLDEIRRGKPVTREHAELSYRSLLAPAELGDVTTAERLAVATFVARLHGHRGIVDYYDGLLREAGGAAPADAVARVAEAAAATGPAGRYPAGPLSREDTEAPRFTLGDDARAALGPKIAAALAHAHMLVFRPREASPEALGLLLEAGWSTTGIVVLSQLVAFLAFQIRVVAGLTALQAA